jgi:DNA mismatch endonuclease (patch repair protein)
VTRSAVSSGTSVLRAVERPLAASEDALSRMRRQKRKGTNPEMGLRRALHHRGYRYAIDRPVLIGSRRRHDLVFPAAKVAVEVMGCFWHSCPEHGTTPKANREWWVEKLAKNAVRDADTARQLEAAGWRLVVVWEHEDSLAAAERVIEAVKDRR